MATNNEMIRYYGRSSQTVYRYNLMTTVEDVSNNVHHLEDLPPPEISMEKRRKQFYTLNMPSDLSHSFTPGVMVCSETVHRHESFVAKVSAPASLRELPSPKSLFSKKPAAQKRKLENNGLCFSPLLSHLRDIKAKQAKFEWAESQQGAKCVNRRLKFETSFETSAQQVCSNHSEDPIEATPLILSEDQLFDNYPMQEEQLTTSVDPEIFLEKDEPFTFRPRLMFEDFNKQQESQNGHTKAPFKFAEE